MSRTRLIGVGLVFILISFFFLGATKHLYNWLCPSVGRSVGWSVGRVTHSFNDPHVAPYWPTWPCFNINESNQPKELFEIIYFGILNSMPRVFLHNIEN